MHVTQHTSHKHSLVSNSPTQPQRNPHPPPQLPPQPRRPLTRPIHRPPILHRAPDQELHTFPRRPPCQALERLWRHLHRVLGLGLLAAQLQEPTTYLIRHALQLTELEGYGGQAGYDPGTVEIISFLHAVGVVSGEEQIHSREVGRVSNGGGECAA